MLVKDKKFILNESNYGVVPHVLKGHVDKRWEKSTYYNHYNDPRSFMNSVVNYALENTNISASSKSYIQDGINAYKNIKKFSEGEKKAYESALNNVKEKLVARGLITSLLAGNIEMTNIPTGVISHAQVALGRPDCWIKTAGVTSGRVFHDLYINLSYSSSISDAVITKNALSLLAIVNALSKVVPMRIFVVNHVGIGNRTSCYSYCLKQLGNPINVETFMFFITKSKRTFGWATYDFGNLGHSSKVGKPDGTIDIGYMDLNNIIDDLIKKMRVRYSHLFQKK